MDRRDPEAWAWALVIPICVLGFIIGWGFFVRWIVEVWG